MLLCIVIAPDPMLLVDEEDIREGPIIITNQQGNVDKTEQERLTEIHTIYQQQPGMYNNDT